MEKKLQDQISRIKLLNENMGLPGIDDKNGFKVPVEAKEQDDMGSRLRSGLHSTDVDKETSSELPRAQNLPKEQGDDRNQRTPEEKEDFQLEQEFIKQLQSVIDDFVFGQGDESNPQYHKDPRKGNIYIDQAKNIIDGLNPYIDSVNNNDNETSSY